MAEIVENKFGIHPCERDYMAKGGLVDVWDV